MGADTHGRVKHLLADALTLPPHEREAFVRAQSDDAVIVREVLELLAEGTDLIAPVRLDDLDSADELVGTQVGHYRIVDRLDAGGQGEVYLGRDTDLHRKVALKSLLPTGAGADVRSAALREARAAAQVTHPNVATIHHVLEHNSRAFIVMEFVEGESLAKLLRRGRLPLVSVYAIGRQLAGAVAAAHSKGVVHRDLKPANVQVLPDGSIKVLDFGIAGVIAALTTMTRGRATEVPQAGQPGTPGYMAPEQVVSAQFDERTDIFSLGILLFEMVTGTRAYQERDTNALLSAVARPLPRADHVAPDVPRELADVIEKAVQVRPGDRFESATALGRAIEAVAGSPSTAGAQRRPFMIAARVGGVVVAAVLAVGLLGLIINTVFNLTTGRHGPFGREPVPALFLLGVRSLVLPVIYIVAMLIALWAARFVVGLLTALPPVGRLVAGLTSRGRVLASRLRLDRPAEFSQAMVTLGLLWIVFVIVTFSDLLYACMSNTISTAPAERLSPLRYDHRYAPVLYRIALEVLVLVLGLSLARIRRLRFAKVGASRGATAPLIALLVITVLMLEAPYRLLWSNQAERMSFAGERCYPLGQDETRVLLYCPDREPPRNQEVLRTDPRLAPTGQIESIFVPPS